jgi:hypothetical protein
MNKTKVVFLTLLLVCVFEYSVSTLCRDGSYCPVVSTCCLTPHGVGCCPYQNAVCCGDGLHCCPYGFQCSATSCFRKDSFIDMPNDFTLIDLEANNKGSSKPESRLMEIEIKYILEYCVGEKFVDTPFKDMLINCKEKEKDYEASQNCKFALLHIMNEGLIRSPECYDRVNSLIKRL